MDYLPVGYCRGFWDLFRLAIWIAFPYPIEVYKQGSVSHESLPFATMDRAISFIFSVIIQQDILSRQLWKKMKRIFWLKYPKLEALGMAIIIAYVLFNQPQVSGFFSGLEGLGYLGAFIAGLVVASSQYRSQALSDLIPFREVLGSVFFVSIGMLRA